MNKFVKALVGAVSLTAIATTASAGNTPELHIENFIGTVDIITGDYDEVSVTDADGAPIEIRRSVVIIDGGYKINNAHCKSSRSRIDIGVGSWNYLKRSGGYKNIKEYPKVKIKAPRNMHLVVNESVIFGDVEDIGSADLHIASCGDIRFGNINGTLDIGISGSGDVKMGDAGPSHISISGSGDFDAGDLASAEIYVSGSGDLEVGDILGHAKITSSGAGDINVARIKGGLEYKGSGASDFDAEYVGGGDLYIRSSGSGDVSVDDGDVAELDVKASGASDIVYGGQSQNAKARANGASDVTIYRPKGDLYTSDSGAGDVHVK